MRNKFKERRPLIVIMAILMMLCMTFLAVSCGQSGGSSAESPAVTPAEDGKEFGDKDFPEYETESPAALSLTSLRQRRDELIAGIKGGSIVKDGNDVTVDGYKSLFEKASNDTSAIAESRITYNPDPNDRKLEEFVSKVNVYIGKDKTECTEAELKLAADMLYGNVDLNGLYGVYRTAYRFYSNYIYSPGAGNEDGNGGFLSSEEYKDKLAGFHRLKIISEASKVLSRQLKIDGKIGEGHIDCTTECNAAFAKEYVENFKETTVRDILVKNELSLNKLSDANEKLLFYYTILFNPNDVDGYGKYEDETVNADGLTAAQIVYGRDKTAEAADTLAAIKYAGTLGLFRTMFTAGAASDKELDKYYSDTLNAYFAEATVEKGLKTYTVAANERAYGFGKTAAIDKNDSEAVKEQKISARLDELEKTEEYLNRFDNLAKYTLKLSGGEVKVDLKSLTAITSDGSEQELEEINKGEYSGADWAAAKSIVTISVGLTKDAIGAVKAVYADKYGISAEATISNNVAVANGVAETLGSRYGEEKPKYTASETVTYFRSCYETRFTPLKLGEKSTEWLNKFLNISSIEFKPSADDKIFSIGILNDLIPSNGFVGKLLGKLFPKEKIPSVKLTAVDGDGNEVNAFDKNAKLNVRIGASPSIERNINLILNKSEKKSAAQSGFTEAEKTENTKLLENAHSLKYYVTLSIMVPAATETAETAAQSNTNYIMMTDSELDDIKQSSGGIRFKVEFTFDKEKVQNASEFVALGYEHTKIKFVCKNEQENKDGDEDIKMAVLLNDVSTSVSMAITSPDTFKNIALYVAIGIVALILIICIIWIIVANVRRNKYKVKYDAMGGKFAGGQKVKLCKNLVYPNNPSKKGYRFVGWYTDRKCTKKFEAVDKAKSCTTVYAKWVPASRYDKIEEAQDLITKRVAISGDYRGKANGTYGTGVHQAVYDEDPRIMKLEIEKLSYEAKKAEEERKAEEVRLQTIREIEAAKGSDDAKEKAEAEAEKAKLALQQALAEREALISLAKAEERAKLLEQLNAEKNAEAERAAAEKDREEKEELKNRIAALESAQKGVDEERVGKIVDDKLKEYDALRAKEISDEKARLDAELAAKIAAEQARAAALSADKKDEKPEFDAAKAFDELKAELLGYKSADDLDYGLTESDVAAMIKVEGNAVVLEVDAEKSECEAKGFKAESGTILPAKVVVAADEDIKDAKELIEDVLYSKGLMKAEKAPVTKCSDEEMRDGFTLDLAKGRLADNAEEYLKLIRTYAKSFVCTEETFEEKLLMKAFIARGKVYMYLNYAGEGTNAADGTMQAEGLGSFMIVKSAEDCKKALSTIGLMMRENGLVRYPSATSVKEDASDKGFSYTLKA